MTQFLIAIASLCMTPTGHNGYQTRENTFNFQLKCQKEYLKCVEGKKVKDIDYRLRDCVLEKLEK